MKKCIGAGEMPDDFPNCAPIGGWRGAEIHSHCRSKSGAPHHAEKSDFKQGINPKTAIPHRVSHGARIVLLLGSERQN